MGDQGILCALTLGPDAVLQVALGAHLSHMVQGLLGLQPLDIRNALQPRHGVLQIQRRHIGLKLAQINLFRAVVVALDAAQHHLVGVHAALETEGYPIHRHGKGLLLAVLVRQSFGVPVQRRQAQKKQHQPQ